MTGGGDDELSSEDLRSRCVIVSRVNNTNNSSDGGDDTTTIVEELDELEFPSEEHPMRVALLTSRKRVSSTSKHLRRIMSDAVSYKNGSFCAAVVGGQIHQRSPADLLTKDGSLGTTSFTMTEDEYVMSRSIPTSKKGESLAKTLDCAPILIKWIRRLSPKIRSDMLRLAAVLSFSYSYDGDGHHRHLTRTTVLNPTTTGVWHTSTRGLYDEMLVRVRSMRRIEEEKRKRREKEERERSKAVVGGEHEVVAVEEEEEEEEDEDEDEDEEDEDYSPSSPSSSSWSSSSSSSSLQKKVAEKENTYKNSIILGLQAAQVRIKQMGRLEEMIVATKGRSRVEEDSSSGE